MSTILVPVINESPNTISVTFQSEYSVPFEMANPDGVPANCQVGGPGVIGGPEYVNMLQRAQVSAVAQSGYRYEEFELPGYPNHTFLSFKNFTTGAKNVVAFKKGVATDPTAAPSAATITAAGGAGGATLTATVPVVPNAVLYRWTGTAILSQTSVVTGVSVNTLTYVAAAAGSKNLICTITTESGQVVVSNTKTITLS
jgi:hypothetical protein